MPTNTQKQAFKKFVQTNNINIDDITEEDAQEFVASGTVKRFTPEPVEFKTEDTFLDESITWQVKEPEVIEPEVVEPEVIEPQEVVETEETMLTEDIVWKQSNIDEPEDELKKEDIPQEKEDALNTFNNLINSGASFEDVTSFIQKNPQYKDDYIASYKQSKKQGRKQNFVSKYGNATQQEINQGLKSGNIIIGSDEFNSLSPQKQNEIKALNKQQNSVGRTDLSKFESTLSFNDILTQVQEVFSSDVREKSEQLMNNPELSEARWKMSDVKKKISSIDDKLENLEDDLKGSTISRITMNSKLREQRKSLLREKNLLIDEYNAELSTYKLIKDDISDQIWIYKEEDAQNRQNYMLALNLYQQNRAEMREDEKLAFQEQSKERASQTAFNNQIALIDYKNSLENTWVTIDKWESRYDGIYALKSDWTAELVVNGGQSKLWDTFVKTRIWTDWEPITEVFDIDGNSYWATNNSGLNDTQISLLNAPDQAIIPTRLNKDQLSPNNPWGKECWEYVNDIFASSIWAKMWDTYQSKLNVANETQGALWSIAVWQPDPNNAEFSKYGHAGVIVWEDGDNWVIKSSNLEWDGRISVATVPKSVIDGYRSTNIFEKDTYSDAQKKFMESISIDDFSSKKESKATAESLWLTVKDVYDYKSQNVPKATKSQFETLLRRLNNLKWEDWTFEDRDGFSASIGFGLSPFTIPWSSKADYMADLDTFLANITIDNLDKMSGVLTDKDIEILKDAGTAISSDLSEEQFVERIWELERIYKRALGYDVLDKEDVYYTDSDGVEYSKESLKKEILRKLQDEEITVEQLKGWKGRNNIILN